jgi:hypothetical protein
MVETQRQPENTLERAYMYDTQARKTVLVALSG